MKTCKDCGKAIDRRAARCHSCAAKERWEKPEYKTRISDAAKRQWETPELRVRASETMRLRWENPEFRATISKQVSEQMKLRWENPENRTAQSERSKRLWESPAFRAMQSERLKRLWENPEYRAMKSEQRIKLNKQLWEDPRFRASMTGENHPNWRGGLSFGPYGLDFNDTLKRAIRKRDNHTCAVSGEPGRCVHHVNYDKTDNRPENLITLNRGCHSKTNYNREYWESFLSPIAIERMNQKGDVK